MHWALIKQGMLFHGLSFPGQNCPSITIQSQQIHEAIRDTNYLDEILYRYRLVLIRTHLGFQE